MHSGRLNLASAWISYWTCNAEIFKGTQSPTDRADLDTTFVSLKSVYLNPKSNERVGFIQKSASILPSVSFDPRSFTENLFLSKR